jgi:hypothetical protein
MSPFNFKNRLLLGLYFHETQLYFLAFRLTALTMSKCKARGTDQVQTLSLTPADEVKDTRMTAAEIRSVKNKRFRTQMWIRNVSGPTTS